jgi:FKBP-type peptidyl-prolyl cis-trans isomerase
MKHFLQTMVLFFIAIALLSACNSEPRGSADLSSQADSVSYSIGYLQGMGLAQEGIDDLSMNNYLAGLQKALDQEEAEIDQMAMQMVIQQYLSDKQAQQAVRQAEDAERNRAEGEEFLAENAQRDDVETTDSGLQYRVIEEGDGERPTADDVVEVHYTGTLLNGDEFDSSHDRGEPASFPLNGVISGWTEGVQLMSVGSTYEFFIPADLAYGDNPNPQSPIPPGATLIFEIELLDILDQE